MALLHHRYRRFYQTSFIFNQHHCWTGSQDQPYKQQGIQAMSQARFDLISGVAHGTMTP
jgi:hypothetical protein